VCDFVLTNTQHVAGFSLLPATTPYCLPLVCFQGEMRRVCDKHVALEAKAKEQQALVSSRLQHC
jgi:hypothetical protein